MRINRLSEITRRDIVDWLLLRGAPFHGRLDLMSFLGRVWQLSDMPSTDHRFQDAHGDIWQHMVNNDDWDYEYLLLERLDLLSCPDTQFLRFLEECVHPLVVPNQEDASRIAGEFNKYLAADGFVLKVSRQISGRPIWEAVTLGKVDDLRYEVALSFAGEDRAFVDRVAEELRRSGVEVFYDKYEEVTLWGKDLVEHLDKVFRGQARYCVMFVSEHYRDKMWPLEERRSAFARAIQEREEYILPVRFDETEIPGLRPTVGYVDARQKSPQQLAQLILKKLGREPTTL